jgi:hypothetical protein
VSGVTRRAMGAGVLMSLLAPAAFAASRAAVEGAGTVAIPGPWKTRTEYPNRAENAAPALVAYRNWRSTLSGYPECDGLLAVGAPHLFKDLNDFVGHGRAALSIQWSDADRIPGQPWDGNEKRYQAVAGDGPDGPEITQQLAVHRVGFFDVYDEPASLFAVAHRGGLHVAVWQYDKHGGLKGARRLASRIVKSHQL